MIESIPAGPEGPPGPEGPTDPRAKWGYKTFRLSDGVTTVTDTQLQRLGDYQLECPVNSWFIVLFSATFRNPSESEIKVQAHIDGTSVLSWEYRVVPKDLETTTLHFTSNTAYAAGSHTLSLYLLNSSSWNTEIYVEKLLITVISIPVS